MTTSTHWQLARDAAARYEEILVPTILGPAAAVLVESAVLRSGTSVLDVGCGTGAAARFAAARAGTSGRVVGIDVNPGMIEVARSVLPVGGTQIEWVVKSAYELPFQEAEFDVVLCAQTLQFLDDRPRALAEMYRVLRPGGRIALSLWCELRENPYFDALVEAVARHIGADTAGGLRAAFGLSDATAIRTLVEEAGFRGFEYETERMDLTLPDPDEFVPRHIGATPMVEDYLRASNAQRQAVVREMSERLTIFTAPGGIRVPFRTHLVKASK